MAESSAFHRFAFAREPTGLLVAGQPCCHGGFLHLSGKAADLDVERILGGELQIGSNLAGPLEAISKNEDVHMVEMIISADSEFIGRRIGDLRFTLRYGLELLGIHREHNQPSDPNIGNWVLHAGDVLLVQGAAGRVEGAKQERDLLALDGKISLPRTKKAPLAIGIMAAVVAAAASGTMPIALAAILGAVAMLLTQCVLPRNLGKAVSAEVILLIPASLALGKALTVTGGAEWIAGLLLTVADDFPVGIVLAGIIALMSLLTNFISNNAAAVIGTPIAIAIT